MRVSVTLRHIQTHSVILAKISIPVEPRGRWLSPARLRTGFLGGRLAPDSFSCPTSAHCSCVTFPIYYSKIASFSVKKQSISRASAFLSLTLGEKA